MTEHTPRSVAGLWAARICADHFEEVIIVEPEAWLGTEEGKSPVYDTDGVYVESNRVHARARAEQYTAPHSKCRRSMVRFGKERITYLIYSVPAIGLASSEKAF